MSMPEILLVSLAAFAGLWAVYLLLLPALAALRRPGMFESEDTSVVVLPAVIVIVPSHNVEEVIGTCVHSLMASDYPRDNFEVFVIADHCADNTIDCARTAGASVLARTEGPRGKTFTLAWAFAQLTERSIDPGLFVVVDATVRVAPDFLRRLAVRAQRGEDIIVGHAVVDPENQQWFAQCVGLSLVHRNLQNWSRERLGLSALIEGRGMAYSRHYIKDHGWRLALPESGESGTHPTEDWRHGVRVVEEGFRVSYEGNAQIFTPLRHTLSAATKQGIRWERGRTTNAATYGLGLVRVGLQQRSLMKVLAGLDAVQPPVAVLGGFCIALALVAFMQSSNALVDVLALAPLILVCIYAIAVLVQGRREGISARTVIWAPFYVAWRCLAYLIALSPFGKPRVSERIRKFD